MTRGELSPDAPLTPEERDIISIANLLGNKKFLKRLPSGMGNSASLRGYTPYPNLRAEMDAHQLSISGLARLMEKQNAYMSRRIRGVVPFSDEEKRWLSEYFNRPIAWLFALEKSDYVAAE